MLRVYLWRHNQNDTAADTDDDSPPSGGDTGARDLPPARCTRICHPDNDVVNTAEWPPSYPIRCQWQRR